MVLRMVGKCSVFLNSRFVSSDAAREIIRALNEADEVDEDVAAISLRQLKLKVEELGEVKLKGLENPEVISRVT